MKPLLILAVPVIATLMLAPLSLPAQEAEAENDMGEGFNLMQEGAQLLFRGLMDEIEPTMKDLEGLADDMATQMEPAMRMLTEEMGPALMALIARIDDIRNYEAPEFLENGDIIIRRSPDAPEYVPTEDPAGAAIDL